MDFDSAWQHLVESLTKSFFVINNIEKASGLINVSFTSDTPEKWVTGGRIKRMMNDQYIGDYYPARGGTLEYDERWKGVLTRNYTQKIHLSGTSNIYLKEDGNVCILFVNTQYVLTINISGTYIHYSSLGRSKETGYLDPFSSTIAFNTHESTKDEHGITWQSTGLFEDTILSFLSLNNQRSPTQNGKSSD